jgi:E3 ubiquitin-protein ligase RNF14
LENGDGVGGAPEWDVDAEADLEERLFDDASDESSGEDDDGPEWEFAGESDEENPNLIGHRHHPPPPPAPVPPRGMHPANPAHLRHAVDINVPHEAVRAAAAERQAQAEAIARARNRPPLGRGPLDVHNRPDRNRVALAPHRIAGLQRFLNLVQNDQEDEWDSDELGDDF